jgi:hypothetical protein
MNPSESKSRFEQFVAGSGGSVTKLTAADAIRHMLAFYRQVRALDCPLNEDGDMILFQWGAYNFGQGDTYRYDITRQFIMSGSDGDDGMSQLSLTVHFAVTEALRALKKGNRWCSSPSQADEFEQFIRSHQVTAIVASLTPTRTTLVWSPT